MIRLGSILIFGALPVLAGANKGAAQVPAAWSVARIEVADRTGQVILADVTGDGVDDLITRHPQSRTIRVFAGTGPGRFGATATATIPLSFTPGDMRLGRVDGNDAPDLVVTSSVADTLAVFLADGRGGFNAAPGSPFLASTDTYRFNKRSLHLFDFNGDGFADVVTANRRGQTRFRILIGRGDGRFSPGPLLEVNDGRPEHTLAFTDVNGDGKVDAIIAASGTQLVDDAPGLVTIALWDGARFTRDSANEIHVPARPRVAAVADMNRDGRPDVVLGHETGVVSVLISNGAGLASWTRKSFTLRNPASSMVAAHVDGDESVDLIAATGDAIEMWLNKPAGFTPAPGLPVQAGPGAYNVFASTRVAQSAEIVASAFESTAITWLARRTP